MKVWKLPESLLTINHMDTHTHTHTHELSLDNAELMDNFMDGCCVLLLFSFLLFATCWERAFKSNLAAVAAAAAAGKQADCQVRGKE